MTRWLQTLWRLVVTLALVATWGACVPESDDGSDGGFGTVDGSDGTDADSSVPADTSGGDTGPQPDSTGEDDAGPDAVAEDDARDEAVWPPVVEAATDAVQVDSKGGTFELLDGQVVLTVPATTFADGTKLTLERGVFEVGDDSLVGYIWGPHGDAVDPPATVEVTVPARWLPPFDAGVATDGLYMVSDTGELEVLSALDVRFEGDDVVMTGEIRALGRLVIAGPGQE